MRARTQAVAWLGLTWTLILVICAIVWAAVLLTSYTPAQTIAQDRSLLQISRAASEQCEPFATITRCEGSASLFDERYCAGGTAQERVAIESCTPEGWLRVREVVHLAMVEQKQK